MEDNKLLDFILQKKAIFISLIVIVLGFCGMIITGITIKIENKKVHLYTQDVVIEREDQPVRMGSPMRVEDCVIEMKIPLRSDGNLNSWLQEDTYWGAQYDIYIKNNTNSKFEEWTLTFNLPANSKIDSSWNGFYKKNGEVVSVTPSKEALNDKIDPHGFCKVGFVLYSDEVLTDCSFKFETIMEKSFMSSDKFVFFMIITGVGLLLSIFTFSNYKILEKQQRHTEREVSDVLKLCASFIDTRDAYTRKHSVNVAEYSRLLARELGYGERFQKNIYSIGLLHDVGKVLIPSSILCKPSRLNDEELVEMRKHTIYGAEVLKDFSGIKNVKERVMYHHERYDGKGYVSGLSGENIPIEARIVCVADSFDAMTTDRAYRPHLSKDIVILELKSGMGKQFDPKIAQAMIDLIDRGVIKL